MVKPYKREPNFPIERIMIDLEVVALVIAVVGLIPLYIDWILRMRERGVNFSLERVYKHVTKPIETNCGIRILHPDKLIERCMIFCNDTPLPWSNKEESFFTKSYCKGKWRNSSSTNKY